DSDDAPRTPSGINEFDRILGGGIVPGSAVLIGGEPGIGKSTLLLQVARELASSTGYQPVASRSKNDDGLVARATKILYVTSEESARQTRMRATRLGVA